MAAAIYISPGLPVSSLECCACLTDSDEESENEELKVVTWDPTLEPEEMTIHADFEQKFQEYLMNKAPGLYLSGPSRHQPK